MPIGSPEGSRVAAYKFSTTPERSRIMSAIRATDTKPELAVRRLLREIGYPGYRLYRRDLPGTPDIAYLGRKRAILVHGCFWHSHDCKTGRRLPTTNCDYWLPKRERTKQRDFNTKTALEKLGWRVLVVWECELRDSSSLIVRLTAFMASD
nr:very short patch repair endonuclease [Cupriavidus sp. UME77]